MVLDNPSKIEDEHILILQDQEEEDKKDPYSSFMYGLKAPETRRQWPARLKKFFDFGINPKLDLQQQTAIFYEKASK